MEVNTRRKLGLLALTGVVSVAALLRCVMLARRARSAAATAQKTAEVTATRLAGLRQGTLRRALVQFKVHAGVQAALRRRSEPPAHTARAMEDLLQLFRKSRMQQGHVREVSMTLLHEKLHGCLSHLCFHEASQEQMVVQGVIKHHDYLQQRLVQSFRDLSSCAGMVVILSTWKRFKNACTVLQRAVSMQLLHGRRLARAALRKWLFVLRSVYQMYLYHSDHLYNLKHLSNVSMSL
jgi:hypothetical protein